MAQRKSPPSGQSPSGKGAPAKGAASKAAPAKAAPAKAAPAKGAPAKGAPAKGAPAKAAPAKGSARPAGKVSTAKTGTVKSGSGAKSFGGPAVRPAARKPGKAKSIVNQKQTPWGLIWTTVVVVAFAAAVVIAVIVTGKSDGGTGQKVDKNDPYRQPELATAKAINGVTYRVTGDHTHVQGTVKYGATPPVGGDHNGFWADCTGAVYDQAIANENAVHMLEHGAVWITYNAKTLPASQLADLKKYVAGVDGLALSPYPELKAPISLQAWGYQLFVKNASDPRIAQFIARLKNDQKTTPEFGSSCANPGFKKSPSSFGKPTDS